MALTKPPSPRFLWSHPAHLIAGGFGSGYSPVMPGTTGTIFGWASFQLLLPLTTNPIWMGLVMLAALVIGVWACQRTGRDMGVLDHGSTVWDEIVPFWGVLWFTVIATPGDWRWQAAAFVLFRIFDIVKPQPARYFDKQVKNGFGVMADDVVAALYAVLVLWLATLVLR